MHAVIHIVDKDPVFLKALDLTLERAGHGVNTYYSGEAFLHADRLDVPGCLLLSADLPGLNGLQLQAQLVERHDPLPIIFIAERAHMPTAVSAMRNGASDFLQKPVSAKTVVDSVNMALEKDRRQRLALGQTAVVNRRFQRLTARERQIMGLVVANRSSKEIARDLGISPRTVEHHRAHIMQKMGTGSLAELTIMAVLCGVRDFRVHEPSVVYASQQYAGTDRVAQVASYSVQ